ncbi:Acyl-CoA dehydrogenase, C-terminal domain [Salipiger thiooxidans]|uniref:Acyl-CoA dehydrogenase, C-terminal domain n=1 Tax=Salipiger thiooxidans TaxID=282683 RepID=A0A1G7GAN6_9RHOB|nr:Acyl-CoA dehydrogenase, C-terminal domain [Salipiger thiooxidans]
MLLGPGGFKKQISGFNVERLGNSARAVAVGRHAFNLAREHALTLKQFGRALCEFQGLQWKFAEMELRLESAQLLLMRAAVNGMDGLPDPHETALAKLACNEAGFLAANEAVQVLGGLGFSLESIGIRQAESLDTLMDAPRLLSKMRLPAHRPRRLTVLTTTGGGGAMLVDQISARGVEIAGCSAPTREALTAQNIPLGHGKLVDVTLAGTKYDTMKEVVSRLIADPETGALLVTIGSSAQFNPELAVTPIIDAVAEAPRDAAPVLAFPLPHAPESLDLLAAGGVPAFRNVEACAETIAMLMRPVKVTAPPDVTLQAVTATLLDQGPENTLNEDRAGAVFESLGTPRPRQIVLPPEDALPETLDLRFPLVAKPVSSDLPHKTEAGAIRLGLADRAALEEAIAAMRASAEAHAPGYRLEAILLQEMATGLGEALVGLTRDPLAGPMLTLGMGGVMTEIYRDTSVRPAPLDVETAREMIREVKGFMLLDGFRGALRGDLEALAQGVAAISALATSDRVAEAEINPLLVRPEGQGIVLLDALIRRQ